MARFTSASTPQGVVDAVHQMIVATAVNTNAADVINLISITEQTTTNTGQPNPLLTYAVMARR